MISVRSGNCTQSVHVRSRIELYNDQNISAIQIIAAPVLITVYRMPSLVAVGLCADHGRGGGFPAGVCYGSVGTNDASGSCGYSAGGSSSSVESSDLEFSVRQARLRDRSLGADPKGLEASSALEVVEGGGVLVLRFSSRLDQRNGSEDDRVDNVDTTDDEEHFGVGIM